MKEIMSSEAKRKQIKMKRERELSRGICDILDDDNTTYGVNVGDVKIRKPNRKGKRISRKFKDAVHALDDN